MTVDEIKTGITFLILLLSVFLFAVLFLILKFKK